MCKKETDIKKQHNQTVCLMDSLSTASSTAAPPSVPGFALSSVPGSVAGSNDETLRVKFLCSFLGSILPRPLDGKLRYVGGETRIVSLPRDVRYADLMNRMRELYDGTSVLKYQQADEDLDALVSVVNDDDVINMMEEYDKMALSDKFTRLRIFLFSHPDQDGSPHFCDGDERETERRYVDALNTLNDGSDLRRLQQPDSPCINSSDEHLLAEQFFNSLSIEGGIHQRSSDVPMAQYNMHRLKIPHMGSGQYQQAVTQRYSEMDGPWSPGYYSPRHHGHHDPRSLAEYPSSPSSVRYHMPVGELPDTSVDRMPEEYARQLANHHPTFDHQPQVPENVVWMPAGAIPCDTGGFPGNVIHAPGFNEANTVYEHRHHNFPRNQQHMEHTHMGTGPMHAPTPCTECLANREVFMSRSDPMLSHGVFPKDQNDPRSGYNEAYSHERGCIPQHQPNPVTRCEEARTHKSSVRRLNDHYIVDDTGTNFHGHGNLIDGHHMSSTYVRPDVFHDHPPNAPALLHIPSAEERGARYGNNPYGNATDNLYPMTHEYAHPQPQWRNIPNHVPAAPSYDASGIPLQVNDIPRPAFVRGPVENGTRCGIGLDNHYPWVDPSQKIMCFDGKSSPEHSYAPLKLNPNPHNQENLGLSTPYLNQSSSEVLNLAPQTEPLQLLDMMSTFVNSKTVAGPIITTHVAESAEIEGNNIPGESKEANHVQAIEISDIPGMHCPELPEVDLVNSSFLRPVEESVDDVKPLQKDPSPPLRDAKLSSHDLSFLPDVVASVTKAALEGAEEVTAKFEEISDSVKHDSVGKDAAENISELLNADEGAVDLDSNNDNPDISKIEPTKAEEEAIAKGLQTIKNDDLEEFRILGSGTYGAVYHGKWKGSDVAIKRIKASCFAGRPCERERLIADFWKEALILSSLHHPNVVSFYGIVRDGPDGSLATLTEFMINGSLKQFLQKKDRTIDRRKRLIIAMDAAFGMEYLHGKNIVHFDLKCENLLVNMRDPQRPVCKIGDLGLSKVKQHTLVSGGVRGTLPWMAPELLSGKSNMVTEKIDVYSFGIVMWEVLTGEEPYPDMHCASIIGGIVNNTLRPTIPTWCDPEWKSLMESCWAADPVDRPSFSEISQKLRNMGAAINVK